MADILTKPLAKPVFHAHRKSIGLAICSWGYGQGEVLEFEQ
jgi:hypothetical protein